MSDKKYLNKSMVEFVLKKNKFKRYDNGDVVDFCNDIVNYANALSQTPRLGHFIPCDENDVPLEKPIEYSGMDSDAVATVKYYQQALERVLFSNLDFYKILEWHSHMVIVSDTHEKLFRYSIDRNRKDSSEPKTFEDLIRYNLPLTKAGANFFGYED